MDIATKESELMTPEGFLSLLGDLDINFTLHKHRAVFSVGEADDIDAAIPGAHTRNLFLKDKKDNMFLVTLMAHTKIDLSRLANVIGAGRISFGSPERLMKYLGVTPGSVTPFSIINDRQNKVKLILDAEMMQQNPVNYHPLVNTMTVGLAPENLLKFINSAGHAYEITDLSAAHADNSC